MDDESIINLYLQRDQSAIPATGEKYGQYCLSVACNICGNIEDAEECVNDTYWEVWNSIPPQHPRNLRAFLVRITRNLSLNRLKWNTAAKRGSGEAVFVLDELSELVSGASSVEDDYDRKELIDTINSFLDTLSSRKRFLFLRRYWYFDSITTLALHFGTSNNHISVMLSRIRKQLHFYLIERGFNL